MHRPVTYSSDQAYTKLTCDHGPATWEICGHRRRAP